MNRCVNIDWLEVYAHEPPSWDGSGVIDERYLENLGYIVSSRGYGTPTYEEVLFVSFPQCPEHVAFEIRRKPREASDGGSFLPKCSCHIRSTNKFCYSDTPIVGLANFMLNCNYIFQSIKRIDICLDFNRFDSGEDPQNVLRDFITEKLSKINQSKVSAYGEDLWDGRYWNSIRWGSPTSNIATRFYNKSLELKQTKMKTWIQDAWKDSGLDITKPVWRVEFQIKAGQKGFQNIQGQDFHKMKLSMFNNRGKLLFLFHALASKYFHFKYREQNKDGSWKRKDRCRDKKLFEISMLEECYKPRDINTVPDPTRMDKILMKKLYRMQDKDFYKDDIKEAALKLAQDIEWRLYGYISW